MQSSLDIRRACLEGADGAEESSLAPTPLVTAHDAGGEGQSRVPVGACRAVPAVLPGQVVVVGPERVEQTATPVLAGKASELGEALPATDESALHGQGTGPGALPGEAVEVPEGLGQRVEELLPAEARRVSSSPADLLADQSGPLEHLLEGSPRADHRDGSPVLALPPQPPQPASDQALKHQGRAAVEETGSVSEPGQEAPDEGGDPGRGVELLGLPERLLSPRGRSVRPQLVLHAAQVKQKPVTSDEVPVLAADGDVHGLSVSALSRREGS